MNMEKEREPKNEKKSMQLERFLQKKREENEALQKLLKALQKEEDKGMESK